VVIQIGADKKIHEKAKEVCSRLKDCELDDREEYTPGWKFNEWELKGVPLRIELGEKELESGKLTLVRRDNEERIEISELKLEEKVEDILQSIQDNLFNRAKEYLENNIREAENYDRLKEILSKHGGLIKAPWCGETFCEEQIKEETGAKITNIPFKYQEPRDKKCLLCDKKAEYYVHFAKSH
ncbi:MAG: proline--tRNA ligase, partial [Candidatus Aenigmarchaeota archaeon]|nr:proline--tRNA ligase [Candidatus Aenigmarchaeota archaeon]